MQAHPGQRLGGARRTGHHVRPPCRQGGRASAAGGTGCVRARAVRAQALRLAACLHLPRDPAPPSRAAACAPAPARRTRSSSAPASALALRVLLGREKPPYRVRDGAAPTPETASVMGLPFHRLDVRTLVRDFVEGARTGTGGWIVTPNLDILRQYATSPEARELILEATHRVADGLPIVWASRLAGTPLPERVPGSDLILTLPEAAADAGLSVFLLGGNPGVAAAAARRLQDRYPRLGDVGSYCPPFGFEAEPAEVERIRQELRASRPDLVLVGLGFPKQERVIRALRLELPGAWFVGVGISLASSPAISHVRRSRSSGLAWSGCTASGTSRVACFGVTSPRPAVRRQAIELGAEASTPTRTRSIVASHDTASWSGRHGEEVVPIAGDPPERCPQAREHPVNRSCGTCVKSCSSTT